MRRFVGILAILSVVGCTKTTVTVPRMAPAEVNLSEYERLAIGDIAGIGGKELGSELTQALFDSKRFKVLDRQHLSHVLKEQHLGASGAISDETAASIGNVIGSAALIVGDVTTYEYGEQVAREKETCAKGKEKYDCFRFTRTGNANVAALLKLIDTETGEVLAVKNLKSSVGDTRSQIGSAPAPFNAKNAWLGRGRGHVVQRFMQVIAPYQMNVRVELMDDGDLPELETGNNWAKMGKWDQAIVQYSAAVARAGSTPDMSPAAKAKAHYNLGVAMGYSGQYDAGIRELEAAYALDAMPAAMAQMKMLEKFKDDDAKLREQDALPNS